MSRGKLLFMILALTVMLIACAKQQQSPITTEQKPATEIVPQEQQTEQKPSQTTTQAKISPEVQQLFDKSKTKVQSVYYKYRGPETGNDFHEFFVKGTKIKYKPAREIKILDRPESFDSIFIDTSAKTASSYCEAAYCSYKGKKQDLNYYNVYIDTVFDWINVAQASKIGEEVIESRSTWKIQTEKGIIWADAFYGLPLKAEANGNIYKFEQLATNGVQDSDVVPSS